MKSLFKICLMVFAFFLISTQMTFAADVDGMQGISPPAGTTATGPSASKSYLAENAIDTNKGTSWTAAGMSAKLELSFSEPTYLEFVQIAALASPISNNTYTVYGQQNGEWATISSAITFNVNPQVTILDPIEVIAGEYDAIRIDVVSQRSWVSIAEVTIGTDRTPGEPGTEQPGTEQPGTEQPGTEQPGTEQPGTEQPGTEQPGTEQPGTEQPGTEQPGTEQPGTEQPGTEQPGTEQPSGNRAIMVVTMTTGLEKEFDLSMKEVNNFISWYEARQAGSGKASYAIDKHDNNKGPFSSRKDYILYDRVLTFEVSEY
ncbi:hypothetical protein [Paenibacillus massiliensis]|uniref:hypothetical protein n=1 Tax=Paenibacillus massiliensis TaxID=225917 RepID=UPI00040E264C|nr:hypothetical protein [Paenibacillus massiliensis]